MEDDSSREAWNFRCSIDIFIRFLVATLSAITLAPRIFKLNVDNATFNDTNFARAREFNAVSIGIEWLYFLSLVFICKFYWGFSVVLPFASYYQKFGWELC